MSWDIDAFKEKLENNHSFPGKYTFKFIVKPEQKERVFELVSDAEHVVKPSSGNKYVSITIHAQMTSSDAIIEVYKKAREIEGIISL